MNQATSILASGDGAWGGPATALTRALEGPGSFDSRRFLWYPSSDLLDKRPVRALEAWPLCAWQPHSQIKVIFSK